MKFIVLDCETSGLNPNYHELTELSILNCETLDQYAWDIKIKHPERCDTQAMFITNKTPEQLVSRGDYLENVIDDIDNVMSSISEYPDEIVCIGHNCAFDRNWLEIKFSSLNKTWRANYWLDTMAMSKKFTKNNLGIPKTSHALSNMIKLAGIKAEGIAHSAIVDVQATYKLYNFFLSRGMKNSEFIKLSPKLMENLSKPTQRIKKTAIATKEEVNDAYAELDNNGIIEIEDDDE